jgi:Tfp pilus assembly protein PilW
MKNPQLVQTSKRGFTLIITISLLVLLTMVAVGVLSLSSVTLRASNQGNASAVARANARLALMLAIGDLQVTMGPDRAATGKAGSLFPDSPRQHLLGAWQGFGWQAPSGLAPAPSEKQQKFSRWLTSVSDQTARYDLNYGSTGSAADEVFLINSQTSGTCRTGIRNGKRSDSLCGWAIKSVAWLMA